jgi:mono/diheme cytochrome c family protein
LGAFLPSDGTALPFNQDMVGQQFVTGSVMRQKAPHTVPVGTLDRQLPERSVIVQTWKNPFAEDASSATRGARLFETHCTVCHGVVQEGKHTPSDLMKFGIPSINLQLSQQKFDPQKTDGYLWAYIFWGLDAVMPRYGYKFSNDEVWDLVTYIRKLQEDNPIG